MQLDLEREDLTFKQLLPSKDQVIYLRSSQGGKISSDALKSYPECFQRKLPWIDGQLGTNNLSCSLPRHAPRLIPLALHAGLTTDEQLRVFEPAERGSRKLIVSTNIAEVSFSSNAFSYPS